jgi:hypothetical protein
MIKKLGSSCYFMVVLFNFFPFWLGNFQFCIDTSAETLLLLCSQASRGCVYGHQLSQKQTRPGRKKKNQTQPKNCLANMGLLLNNAPGSVIKALLLQICLDGLRCRQISIGSSDYLRGDNCEIESIKSN